MWFDRRDPLGRELAKRIATISHIPLENEEVIATVKCLIAFACCFRQ